ncbi:hypothetical protein [Nocardia mexicana]|uniref:hypothetical protein n=1 Tax=Nocardia mexicana TaxID=279262 RepID=UPI0011C02CD5|nr:hypothetical protein [Nocardia mexicana]
MGDVVRFREQQGAAEERRRIERSDAANLPQPVSNTGRFVCCRGPSSGPINHPDGSRTMFASSSQALHDIAIGRWQYVDCKAACHGLHDLDDRGFRSDFRVAGRPSGGVCAWSRTRSPSALRRVVAVVVSGRGPKFVGGQSVASGCDR